jgi:hypothetical protein
MLLHHPQEIDLFRLFSTSPECTELDVRATLGIHAGVIVLCRGRPIGYWFAYSDTLVFQTLPRKETRLEAADPLQALSISLRLVATDALPRPVRSAA